MPSLECASPRIWDKGARYDLGPSNAGFQIPPVRYTLGWFSYDFYVFVDGTTKSHSVSCYLGLLPACFNVFAKRDRVQLVDKSVLSRLG